MKGLLFVPKKQRRGRLAMDGEDSGVVRVGVGRVNKASETTREGP